jgi:N-acetylglucosaminyl-diphospho-decaprenol L-rhamnosyltransferase
LIIQHPFDLVLRGVPSGRPTAYAPRATADSLVAPRLDTIALPVPEVQQAAGGEPPITVAVVSWNTRDLLDRCLQSLRPDAAAGLAEVWVVDNESADGSADMVARRHPWATLVRAGSNLGFGAAINLVAGRSRGRFLAAANADVTLEPGALARLRLTAEQAPRTGMVGPRLLLLDGSAQVSIQPFPGLWTTALMALHADRFSARAARALRTPDAWEPAAAAPVPWVTGAFVLIARAAFEQAGGFDPGQWLYGEDLDLCWRIRAAGWQIVYEPAAIAHHAHSAASAQRFDDSSLLSHIDAVNYLWMLRRRGALQTRAAAALGIADAAVRVGVLGLAERREPERFAGRTRRARAALRQHLLGLRSESELERHVRRARGGD